MTKEERAEYNRVYRERHRERLLAEHREWWASNADRIAEARRRAYKENLDESRARRREWARINRPDHVRRARMSGSSVGRVDYAAILREWDGKCHICRMAVAEGAQIHFDHIVPLAKGGAHVSENIWPAHATCNLRKQDRILS